MHRENLLRWAENVRAIANAAEKDCPASAEDDCDTETGAPVGYVSNAFVALLREAAYAVESEIA